MSTEPEDIRFNYIQTVSQQILNYALKCWKDIIWNEDIQAIIKDYLEGSEILTLFIYLDQDNSLKITLKLPQKSPIPAKICFFLKRNVIVSDTDYKRELSFGCIYDYPLQEYQYIFSRVLSPIFSNAVNNEKWPAETFQDMYEHFEDFQMTLSYHIGICQERTILLIPETAKMIDSYNIDELSERSTYDLQLQKTLISITEMLSSWFLIVRQVLETTSESVLKKIDQGPLTEIYFWNERGKNLEFIFSQLNKPIVKKMVLALEKTKSCHYPKFKILLREVAEGLDEAKDISESFDHVTAKVNELEESSLQELKSLLPETMKSITSSWIGSKYYNRVPSRVTVLLKKCCIFISDKINTFLDAKTLFKIDRQEAKGNLKLSIDVTNVFLEAYEECREKFRDIYENELYPWDFPDERVFSQFKLFLLRLDNIHDILLSADVYFNIPHYKLASIHHKTYDRRLLELYSAFCSSYAVFENCSYNPLDIQSMDFAKDFEHFTGIVLELDHKLGIIIGQACLDCIPPEDGFKLIDLLQGLMKRPVVEMEFKKLIPSHMENIYEDLIAAQKSYSGLESKFNESSEVFVYKNLPKISGILQWSNDLFSKITLSVQMLEKKQEYFPTPEMYDFVIKAYFELQDLLEGLRQKVISHWEETLNILKVKLNDVVFVKDDADVTRLNFKPEIHEMTKEIEFLKHIEKANLMPDHEFDWVTKEFKLSQSLLANCISWYTDLNENLLEQEKQLVIQQWSEIKSFIEEGLSINWTRVDILKFAENMYNVTKKVFENVHLSKLNISEVEKFISTWNTTPMFTRASPDSLVDFEIYMNEEVRNKKDSAKKSTEMMQSVMEKNKNIFEADAHSTEWNDYIHYLDSIIEEGLKTVVKSSLQYLNDNTDSSNQKLFPFYKITMQLEQKIVFAPPLNEEQPRNFIELFENVIQKIFSLGSDTKRVTDLETDTIVEKLVINVLHRPKQEENYYEFLDNDEELKSVLKSLRQHLKDGVDKIMKITEDFNRYADLWLLNIEKELEDFTLHGPVPEEEEGDYVGDDDISILTVVELKPPTEEEFKTEISHFDQLFKIINDLESIIEVESWLILDITLFKDSLLEIIRNWQSSYKKKFIEMKHLGMLRKLQDEE